jgi:hypothetical protein
MSLPRLPCPKCEEPLSGEAIQRPDLTPCPRCGVPLQVEVFPAFFRPPSLGRPAEVVVVEGESSCFYHPQKRAVVACESCGRFLCGLCDCDLHGRHFCPACLETGVRKGRIQNLENERTLYDAIALSLAVLPLLIFYFTIITAPMALYFAIRYWKAPLSLVRRSRYRFVLAIGFASLEIVGWVVGIYAYLNYARLRR